MSPLLAALHADLDRPPRADAAALAGEIVRRHGDTVAAILFYGSCLRDGDPDGVLDFYVLVDDYRAFHGGMALAAANRLLPPNVIFLAGEAKAKVAIISRRQFRARMRPASLDTTLWARFCQPAAILYCRDQGVRDWVCQTLALAVTTAVHWALRLGPLRGSAAELWTALFRQTYGAELRVERQDRAAAVAGFAPERFDTLLPLAARPDELTQDGPGTFRVTLDPAARRRAQAGWRLRRRLGKALNLARLSKALFTFEGGLDYIVWKLERHSRQKIVLTPWQRRHPLLAAPGVLASLHRRGIIR
jgi:hypothetical protein